MSQTGLASTGTVHASERAAPGVPLTAVIKALRLRLPIILLLGLVGAAGAYLYARTLPKSYTASSLIAVSGTSFAIPELQGALRAETTVDQMPIVRTEMQALTSRDVVLQAVRQLHLADVPEFNPDLQSPSLVARTRTWLQSFRVVSLTRTWLQLFLPVAHDASNPSDPTESVISVVSDGIKTFQDSRSLAIDISFVSHDPQLSATITNTLVADYLDIRAKRQVSANVGANEVMTQRIDDVRREIAGLESQIQVLRDSNEIVLLRAGSVGQQQVEELATAASKASVDRARLEATYNRAMAAKGSTSELIGVLSSPSIVQLREREGTASQRVADLSARYGPSYPSVVSAQADLAAARSQLAKETDRIVASMSNELKAATEHETDIKAQLDAARRSASTSENVRAKLQQLQDEVVSRQKLYQTMLERAQQTSTQPAGTRPPDVYIISTAAAPLRPSAPNMKLVAVFGGIAGGAVGCLASFLLMQPTTRHNGKEQAMAAGLPVLARLFLSREGQLGELTAEDAAAMRALAQRLRQPTGQRPHVLLFVGTTKSSSAAAQVADAYARAATGRGDRVLFLDGDLAMPGRAGRAPSEDLIAALHGANWPEAANQPCLQRYAAPQSSPGSMAELGSPIFANLVTQAREAFDLVVLLSPPGDDAAILSLARQADTALLVLGPGRDPASDTIAERLTASTPGPVAALILT